MKADGYITGRTDTLNLFNGLTLSPDPTFGSDALGNLSPATALGFLRGGDASGDNQVDLADANLIFSLWNLTPAESYFHLGRYSALDRADPSNAAAQVRLLKGSFTFRDPGQLLQAMSQISLELLQEASGG